MSDWKTVLAHYLTQNGKFGERAEVEDALDEMADDIAHRATESVEGRLKKAITDVIAMRRPLDAVSRQTIG